MVQRGRSDPVVVAGPSYGVATVAPSRVAFTAKAAATGIVPHHDRWRVSARAGRLRGAARSPTTETGTGLASYVEDTFETGVRPGVRSHMDADEIERLGAEGAAMTLDEAVAYALEGSDPVGPHDEASG